MSLGSLRFFFLVACSIVLTSRINAQVVDTVFSGNTVHMNLNLPSLVSTIQTLQAEVDVLQAKLEMITVTQAVDLDQMVTDVGLNTAKTGITSQQASDITSNNAKVTYPSADAAKVGYLTVTQAVDLDQLSLVAFTGDYNDLSNFPTSGMGNVYAMARTQSNGSVINSTNLSCTRTGTGTYVYTISPALGSANYSVMAQSYDQTNDTNALFQTSDISASGFTLTFGFGDNGTASDVVIDSEHSVIVID